MKDHPETNLSAPDTQTDTSGGDPLSRLEALLEKHSSLASDGDFQSVLKDAREVGNLLRLTKESQANSSADWRERFKRVVELHRRLYLLVKLERDETQDSLEQLRRGRHALQAYQNGGSGPA